MVTLRFRLSGNLGLLLAELLSCLLLCFSGARFLLLVLALRLLGLLFSLAFLLLLILLFSLALLLLFLVTVGVRRAGGGFLSNSISLGISLSESFKPVLFGLELSQRSVVVVFEFSFFNLNSSVLFCQNSGKSHGGIE